MVSELSSIVIRNAHSKDIQSLAMLLLHSFNHGLGEENNRWMQTLIRLSIQADLSYRLNRPFRHYEAPLQCLVAVQPSDENIIMGTVELSVQQQNLWSSSKYLYLSNLAVQPDFRRQGVAYELLKHCEMVGKKWGLLDMSLHVREDNTAARQLYERCGYRTNRVEFNLGSLILRQPQPLFLCKQLK